MSSPTTDSRLFYFGTDTEVRLGDVVLIKRWLRNPMKGTVCYIPGLSPFHKDIDDEGIRQWAIKTEDGLVRVNIYLPEKVQPSRKVVFLARGDASDIKLEDRL